MRELARISGLSAAQVSRIEADDVEKPSVGTLVKLGVALEGDSELLLVSGRQVAGEEAQKVLEERAAALEPARRRYVLERIAVVRNAQASLRRELEGKQLERKRTKEEIAFESLGLADLKRKLAEYDDMISARQDRIRAISQDDVSEEGFETAQINYLGILGGAKKETELELSRVRHHLKELEEREEGLTVELAFLVKQLADLEVDNGLAEIAGRLFVDSTGSPASKTPYESPGRAAEQADPGLVVDRLSAEMARWGATARDSVRQSLDREEFDEAFDEAQKAITALERRVEISLKEIVAQSEGGDPDLREIRRLWPAIDPKRRKKILDFVDDQRRLSVS